MSPQLSDVIPDDPIPAALSRAERHRGRRDVPTREVLDLLATPTSKKKAEPRRARFLPGCARGLLVAASVGALLLMAPSAAGAAPINTSLPVISGTPELGQTLSTTTGTWTDTKSPIVTYEYSWLFCVMSECTDLIYANASTYKLSWSVVGLQVEAVVVATDAEGNTGVAASEETFVVTYNGPYYSVSEEAVGDGSITGFVSGFPYGMGPDANLTCPIACGSQYRYAPGTTIELVATPGVGQTFLGWSGTCLGSAPTCFLTLNGDESITASFTGQPATPPSLPPGLPNEPGATPPAAGATSVPEANENGASPRPAASLPAQLLGIRTLHDQIQAVVKCQEKKSCRLSLAFFAKTTTGHALIAQRSFTVAARRSGHISLALSRTGERLLAKHHRLPVVAQLALRANGRSTFIQQARYTLAA